MSDDWRVRADVAEPGGGRRLVRGLHEHQVERDVRERLGERLPVSASEDSVFVYAETEQQARRAADVLGAVLAEHSLTAQVTLTRWHPEEERWEDAAEPLPTTPEERAAERAVRTEREAQESAAEGPQWEVRIDLDSRHESQALADRLAAEGLRPLRRWRHVFVSCATEDEARALSDRLRGEVPPGAGLIVEGTAADAWELTHPFAILGGIAG